MTIPDKYRTTTQSKPRQAAGYAQTYINSNANFQQHQHSVGARLMRHLPNVITLLRFMLIVPMAILLVTHNYRIALYLFLMASISDGLDGFLARHFQWTSRFGSIADPLADKLFMLGCFSTLAWLQYIPTWVWLLIFTRDIVIVFGALYYQYCIERLVFRPSWVSKLNTVFQLLLIGLLLWHLAIQPVPLAWISTLMWAMVVTTLVSFINYVWVWGRRAWQTMHRDA